MAQDGVLEGSGSNSLTGFAHHLATDLSAGIARQAYPCFIRRGSALVPVQHSLDVTLEMGGAGGEFSPR